MKTCRDVIDLAGCIYAKMHRLAAKKRCCSPALQALAWIAERPWPAFNREFDGRRVQFLTLDYLVREIRAVSPKMG
jgi:hypothetical protein